MGGAVGCVARLMAMILLVAPIPVLAVGTRFDPPHLAEVEAEIAEGDYAAAIDALRLILAVRPDDADALNLLGFSLRKSGEYERAEGFYLRALRIAPDHEGALEYLGELYIETGRPEKALENLARLRALCQGACEAHDDLAAALVSAGIALPTP